MVEWHARSFLSHTHHSLASQTAPTIAFKRYGGSGLACETTPTIHDRIHSFSFFFLSSCSMKAFYSQEEPSEQLASVSVDYLTMCGCTTAYVMHMSFKMFNYNQRIL